MGLGVREGGLGSGMGLGSGEGVWGQGYQFGVRGGGLGSGFGVGGRGFQQAFKEQNATIF